MSALALITEQHASTRKNYLAGVDKSTSAVTARGGVEPFGEDGFSFADLIDIVNPLHHLPVLGSLYRKISGDSIAPAARLAGGALFGGPLGAGLAVVGAVLENAYENKAEGETQPIREDSPEALERIALLPPAAAPVDAGSATMPQAGAYQALSGADSAQLRGGWLVNAAYAGKSSALFEWARDPASEYRQVSPLEKTSDKHQERVSVII